MYFLGDTHGIRPVFSIIDKHKITDSHIIHVGDLGLGFVSLESDLSNLKATDEMLLETNNQLYVVRGNHDNPIFWDKSKGLNLPKLHNLHLVDDYEVLNIEGKNILCIGGAISIDRMVRKDDRPYPSWWEDEEFVYSKEKINKVIRNHRDYGRNIDIVVTHSAPSICYPRGTNVPIVNDWHGIESQHGNDLKGELVKERKKIYNVLTDLKYAKFNISHYFYGHFHSSKTEEIDGIIYKLLNINEIHELK